MVPKKIADTVFFSISSSSTSAILLVYFNMLSCMCSEGFCSVHWLIMICLVAFMQPVCLTKCRHRCPVPRGRREPGTNSLPELLLHLVMSFLPIPEVVRTSLLSSRWWIRIEWSSLGTSCYSCMMALCPWMRLGSSPIVIFMKNVVRGFIMSSGIKLVWFMYWWHRSDVR